MLAASERDAAYAMLIADHYQSGRHDAISAVCYAPRRYAAA